MKKTFFLYFFGLVSMFHIGCKKHSPDLQLPPITQEGKNTFGCKINETIWLPFYSCNSIYGLPQLEYGFQPQDPAWVMPTNFGMKASKKIAAGTGSLVVKSSHGLITTTGNIFDSLYIHYIAPSGRNYYNQRGRGNLKVFEINTLDTIKKIFAGTFSFTLYTSSPNRLTEDSVVITEGRFDFQIIPYYFYCSP